MRKVYMQDVAETLSVGEDDSVLLKAYTIVNGARQEAYDHPARNFQRQADLWNAWFKARGYSVELNRHDVAMMMILTKMAREAYKHKEDNLVDCIGYILCLDKIIKDEI